MKEKAQPLVCYCFGFTAAHIAADIDVNGLSTIVKRIAVAKKSGGCQCKAMHPKGR